MNDIIPSGNMTTMTALDTSNHLALVEQGLSVADQFVNRNYLINLSDYQVMPLEEEYKIYNKIRLFHVQKMVYDRHENINDKLISVYSALQNLGSSALLIINSTTNGIDFYLGVRSESDAATSGMILQKGLAGNFPGSEISSIKNSQIEELMSGIVKSEAFNTDKNVAAVTIVPSARDDDKDRFVQGIEKFIDAMMGEAYTAVIIANPLGKDILETRKRGLEELYSNISSFASQSLSYGTNFSEAVSEGNCRNFANSLSKSISDTNSRSTGSSSSHTNTSSHGSNWNFGIFGTNSGKSRSNTYGTTNTDSWSKAVTSGNTETVSEGTSTNKTLTEGDTRSLTLNHENKTVKNLMEKIDEHLKRINECESFGLWECAGYFVSQEIQTAVVAANTFKALMAGTTSSVENSFVNIWGVRNGSNTKKVLEYLNYGIHPQIQLPLSAGISEQTVTPACMISGNELPIVMGVPHKSITGLTAISVAEFGRNVYTSEKKLEEKVINIGNVYHMGKVEPQSVSLDVNSFSSHCFITGSTGSGKSNTSYRILDEMIRNGVKFLVVEPAKGEYKKDFGALENINIFCTNPKQYRMLKLNPFKFNDNIHVLEHLDRLIEIFSACWPMYAAMPAIFKEAIEKSYARCGWDLGNSIYIKNTRAKYPTFVDLLEILPQIIDESSYSADSKGDYTGALVTRVRSMTTGIAGQIFCDDNDIDDKVLFDENTIVDLSRVGSAETKSLLMGILVMKLNEYRMSTTVGENIPLKHVTVLEEAHNLLKRTSTEQSQEGANLMGKSVEMISSSIAEMRTYGEGFIIIDQSPTAVDISAIKNTNTKIVMRLPEKGDCEAIGMAMGLNDEQILELSKLERGKGVILQNNWLEAVLTSITWWGDKYKGTEKLLDYSEVLSVRGKMFEALYRQYKKRNICMENIIEIIDSSKLTDDKKNEFTNSLRKIIEDKKELNASEFANLITKLLDFKGVFEALPEVFAKKYLTNNELNNADFEKANTWYNTAFNALDQYITLSDDESKCTLIKYLLYNKCREFTADHRFIILYNVLFKSGATK